MEIPRKINKEEYDRFVKLFKTKLRPNEIIYEMKIDEDKYDLLLQYHWFRRTNIQKINALSRKFEERRQNIPDGYLNWISKILGVA